MSNNAWLLYIIIYSDLLSHRLNRDDAMMKLIVTPPCAQRASQVYLVLAPQGTILSWLLVAVLDLSALPESSSTC